MKNTVVRYGLLVALGALFAGCEKSVSDFQAEKFQEIKTKVASEPSWVYLMQKVLDARHGSVRAKSIEVEDLKVQTLGNELSLKADMSNMKSIDVTFRVVWDGMFHKDGFTCMTFVFDKDWNVKRIVPGESDAKIDLGSPRGSAGGDSEKADLAKALDDAKQKMDGVVKSAKGKWNELKPQMAEEFMNLEKQVDSALKQITEELK